MRNSVNKRALSPVSMDAADTGRRHLRTSPSFVRSCGLASLFTTSHTLREECRMFSCVFECVWVSRSPLSVSEYLYLCIRPCRIIQLQFPLHSLVPISHSPFRVLDACSFIPPRFVAYRGTSLQVTLLWSRLQPNILTKDGAIVSLTLASPLPSESDRKYKRFCMKYDCRLDDDVSTF